MPYCQNLHNLLGCIDTVKDAIDATDDFPRPTGLVSFIRGANKWEPSQQFDVIENPDP